jgi:CheY-like chemotaxis protein
MGDHSISCSINVTLSITDYANATILAEGLFMFRALIVDDDTSYQKIYEHVLKVAGFQISSAYNGDEAIQHLDSHEFPHLIILDIKMPYSSGLDVLRYLETYPYLNDMCILLNTAGVAYDDEYRQYATKFPAVHYVLKPDVLVALKDVLKEYVVLDSN